MQSKKATRMKNMTPSAKLFIGAMAAAGGATLAGGLMQWECKEPVRFLSFLVIAAVASRLKVKLPGTNGNLSVNLPFILIALSQLSFPETIVLTAVSAFVQGLPAEGRSMKPVQALFNVSTLVVAVTAADLVYKRSALIPSLAARSLLIALAGAAFVVADTLPVASVISLTENLSLAKVWHEMLELTFAYFALSVGIAAIAATATRYVGWQVPLMVLPVMTATYVSYRRYLRYPTAVAITNLQFATLPAGAREKAEVHHS
jgi:hypothetical protein